MSHSLEAKQTGLHIFDDDHPLAYAPFASEFRLPPADEDMCLRRVRMWGSYMSSFGIGSDFRPDTPGELKRALETVDETLENVAQHTEARLPEHRWGLRREGDDPIDRQYRSSTDYARCRYAPAGYILVAEVEVIDDFTPIDDPDARQQLREGIAAHYLDDSVPAVWGDSRMQQFAQGRGRRHTAPGRVLFDIEPCLEWRQPPELREVMGINTIEDMAPYIRE